MSVHYEWDVEVTARHETADHEAGEILDHWFAGSYAAVRDLVDHDPEKTTYDLKIVLVRDDDHGRSWAYLEDGEGGRMPGYFLDAYGNRVARVPKRFHEEVARHGRE